MKSSRSGSAGVDLINDSQAGREKTVVNMGLSSMASGIDAGEEHQLLCGDFGPVRTGHIVDHQ
jgi:hypothetical protein